MFSPVTINVTVMHRRGNLGAGKERRERERKEQEKERWLKGVREKEKSSSSYRVLRLVRDGEKERWKENERDE